MRWFKDFCVVFGLVKDFHPWAIDWSARVSIAFDERCARRAAIQAEVDKRVEQIKSEQPNDQ